MKTKNFLTNLCGLSRASQCSDIGFDRRLTVGSPSGRHRSAMFKFISLLAFLLIVGVGDVWGTTATFSITGKSGKSSPYTVTGTLSGAPTGATASCQTTYNNANQITNGNSQTLTLSGFDGCTITGLSVSAKSNGSSPYKGAATITININGSSKGSLTVTRPGGTYGDKTVTVTSTTVNKSTDVVITVAASENSFYVESYTITYTAAASCDKSVTLSYDGDASGLHGSFVLKAGSASGSTIAEGGTTANCGSGTTSVVVVPTPDTHYHVASVSATNKTGTISGPDGDGNYTISYTQGSNISSSVTVSFEEDTKYTVTWMSNGSQHTTTQVYSGEKPTFPTNPSSCDGTSTAFYGWTTATWTGKLNDVSSKTIYLSGDAMPAVSANGTIYYAVFAKESATAFEKITSADDIYVGQKIAIVSNKQDYILPSNFAGSTAATHPNSNDNKLTVTSSQVWTITDVDEYGYYKLKNSTTQMGVNQTGGITSGSTAVGNYSTVASWWAFNETTDFDYTVDDCFYMYNWATDTYYNFLENGGFSWVSYYATGITSGNKVWYAMKLYQPERSEYLTTCCTSLGSINGSVFWTYHFCPFSACNSLTFSRVCTSQVIYTYCTNKPPAMCMPLAHSQLV